MAINIPALALELDIKQMGLCDKIIYIVNAIHRVGFTSLANVFIY